MSCSTLKARKRPVKGFASFLSVYDADVDQIVTTWLKIPSTLECPILKTCEECGRCIRK